MSSTAKSLADFCQGQYAELGPYLNRYTVHDLEHVDEDFLISIVQPDLKLLMLVFIRDEISGYLGVSDPYILKDEPVSESLSFSINGVTLTIKSGELDLRRVELVTIAYHSFPTDIILKVKTLNFAGKLIRSSDLSCIYALSLKFPHCSKIVLAMSTLKLEDDSNSNLNKILALPNIDYVDISQTPASLTNIPALIPSIKEYYFKLILAKK